MLHYLRQKQQTGDGNYSRGRSRRTRPDKPEYALHLQHIKAAELVRRARKMVENRKDVTKSELYQAVSHLKSAVAMDPLYAQAYVWLALVYSELDEHARAISTLKRSFHCTRRRVGFSILWRNSNSA